MQNKIINYCQHKLKILGNFLIFAHIEGRPKPYLIRPIRFCGSYGGASEAPPKLSRKESSLTPCCYIAFVCLYIQGSHAKIRTEISKFEQDFRISICEIDISHHIEKRKIAITRLILIQQHGVRDDSFLDILGGASEAPPQEPQNLIGHRPQEIGLKSFSCHTQLLS